MLNVKSYSYGLKIVEMGRHGLTIMNACSILGYPILVPINLNTFLMVQCCKVPPQGDLPVTAKQHDRTYAW